MQRHLTAQDMPKAAHPSEAFVARSIGSKAREDGHQGSWLSCIHSHRKEHPGSLTCWPAHAEFKVGLRHAPNNGEQSVALLDLCALDGNGTAVATGRPTVGTATSSSTSQLVGLAQA